MRIYNLWSTLAVAALAVGFSGCIDDDYDLSDIDTTSEFKIVNLTLPANIEPVTLDNIIEFDDDSKIQPIEIGGETFYALTEKGTLESNSIRIAPVTADAPTLDPTEITIHRNDNTPVPAPARRAAADGSVTYDITEMGNNFTFTADNLDKAIVHINQVKLRQPLRFDVTLTALEMGGKVQAMSFSDMRIQAPKGLLDAVVTVGSYDPATGIWTIPTEQISGNTSYSASLTCEVINLTANGADVETRANGTKYLDFRSQFTILDGQLTLTPEMVNGIPVNLPDDVEFHADYTLNDIDVYSFNGQILYTLEGLDIDPVMLTDIPDFLRGEGTNVAIANPQIYLNLNNPVADIINPTTGAGLVCNTGIQLTALRDDYAPITFDPNNGDLINVGSNKGVAGPYNFVLSPDASGLSIPEGFANPTPVPFSSLSNLVGNPDLPSMGLPREIGIKLINPQIPLQDVKGFVLDEDIPGVTGKYEMVAPLALKEGSRIVYRETEDGWGSEDLDALTITSLKVTAHAVNRAPVAISFTAWPVNTAGQRINAKLETVNTLAADSEQDIEILLTGDIRDLDGITYEATLLGSSNEKPLSPDQTLILTNVRATVSGHYTKKL